MSDVTKCPECGGESRVLMVRKRHGKYVRRRACLDCGHRWTTVELPLKVEE